MEGRTEPFRHPLAFPSFYRLGFAGARRVPKAALYLAADGIGLASYLACRAPAAVVRANLRRVLPGAPEREIARLARNIFRNFARYLVDYGRFRTVPREALDRIIPVLDGKEHLDEAFRVGRGVILVTGHIGNWELGGVFFGRHGVKINVVTLPEGSARIDEIRDLYRRGHNINTIVVDGTPFATLEIMGALRRNEMVAMLVDRWGRTDGVPADFFGREHSFPRGPFALSRATGAAIVSAFVVRDGTAYRGIIEPPFVAGGLDDASCAGRIGEALERVIRRYPDQWYNFVPI